MKQRKAFVVGNWKMNGDLVANEHLFTALRAAVDRPMLSQVDIALCPPYPYLGQAAAWLGDTDMSWGAQDVAAWGNGAYTGEISAAMLADLGCKWVVIGHSERRTLLGETDEMVARKIERALEHDIGVVACIGETLEEREQNRTDEVIERQLQAIAAMAAAARPERFVVAYEPVWAIGTGRSASPQQAQAVHLQIRQLLAHCGAKFAEIRILYGGSVKPANAIQLFAMPDIDGGLIGGASLVAEDFVAICRAAALA